MLRELETLAALCEFFFFFCRMFAVIRCIRSTIEEEIGFWYILLWEGLTGHSRQKARDVRIHEAAGVDGCHARKSATSSLPENRLVHARRIW